LVGAVTLEIDVVELSPQRVLGFVGDGVESELSRRFASTRLETVVERSHEVRAGELSLRGMEQLLQELRLPRVPDLRTRAADVGDGKEIKRSKATLGLHPLCELRDDRRVMDVLLLRGKRHRKVLLDQPPDQLDVFRREAVIAAKAPGISRAEFRMV